MLKFVKRFARDRRATIALITAIFIFPLMFLGVGVPIDLARAIQYRAALQNIADGAALAGSEALSIGANPLQACKLTLAYANAAINNGELLATATPAATLTSPGAAGPPVIAASTYSCNPLPNATPVTTQAAAPNEVSVTVSGSQPMTFLSIYKPSIPVTVASSAIGPQGFITICADAQPNQSGDLSQAYYYLKNSDGSLVNEDGSAVNSSASATLPGATGGVALSAFLGDDKWEPTNNKPTVTPGLGYLKSGYCDAAHTEVAVQVKSGLAQRLGFAYYVISNVQVPCGPDVRFTPQGDMFANFSCLTNDKNYGYVANVSPTTAGNIGGFFTYYENDTPAGTYFLPNGYGSPLGWVNAFYSTDYPASLNSDNYEASSNANANGDALSPIGGDTCYTTYPSAASSTIATVANGYTAASQSCIINEVSSTPNKALTKLYNLGVTISPGGSYNGRKYGYAQTNVSGWDNFVKLQGYGGTTSTGTDLVCLVNNGASYTPTITTYNTGTGNQYSVAKVATGVTVQQENFIIANSSVAPNVYHCPVNTIGSPYYPDPTCAELNGATLKIGWNDMGGILSDDGNYVDLVYSYSCEPAAPGTIINSAIIQ